MKKFNILRMVDFGKLFRSDIEHTLANEVALGETIKEFERGVKTHIAPFIVLVEYRHRDGIHKSFYKGFICT